MCVCVCMCVWVCVCVCVFVCVCVCVCVYKGQIADDEYCHATIVHFSRKVAVAAGLEGDLNGYSSGEG